MVAMDGFPGYKTAAKEELPEAVKVMATSCAWPGTRWAAADNASSRPPSGIVVILATCSTRPAELCTPVTTSLLTSSAPG